MINTNLFNFFLYKSVKFLSIFFFNSEDSKCALIFQAKVVVEFSKSFCITKVKTCEGHLLTSGDKSKQLIFPIVTALSFNFSMEQRALKNVNNYLNTNIYSYLETSGGQNSNIYLNLVHFFNTSVN